MWYETLAFTLTAITLAAVVVGLLVGLGALVDPTFIAECHECRHWTLDLHRHPTPTCFRCRHHRGAHPKAMRSHRFS